MWEYFEEIEQSADQCGQAAEEAKRAFEEFLKHLAAHDKDKAKGCLEHPAANAHRAYGLVRNKILSRIEAIHQLNYDASIHLRLISIRGCTSATRPQELQAMILKQITAPDQPGHGSDDFFEMKAVSALLSEIAIGILALPDLSRHLYAIAAHLKVKNQHLKPKQDAQKSIAHVPTPQHITGDIIMGPKYTSNVTNSNIGAIGVGDNAQVTGTVNLGGPPNQEEHRAWIGKARDALNKDEDTLDQIHPGLYEVLSQFLRMTREIQVEQKSMAELQAKMKETLDQVWAQQEAKGLRPQILPKTLEIAKALAENPLMVEAAKKLLG